MTLAQTLQGYSVVYSVHPSTFGPPTITLYSACLTVILYDKSCDTMHAPPLYNQHYMYIVHVHTQVKYLKSILMNSHGIHVHVTTVVASTF